MIIKFSLLSSYQFISAMEMHLTKCRYYALLWGLNKDLGNEILWTNRTKWKRLKLYLCEKNRKIKYEAKKSTSVCHNGYFYLRQ